MFWHCPFFWLANAFILGILGRSSFGLLAASLAGLAFLALSPYLPRLGKRPDCDRPIRLISRFLARQLKPVNLPFLLLIVLLGYWRTDLAVQPGPLENLAVRQVGDIILFGQVWSKPVSRDDQITFSFKTFEIEQKHRRWPVKDRLKIVSLSGPAPRSGDLLKITGRLLPPDPPGNPGQHSFYWDNKIKGQAACLLARPGQIERLKANKFPRSSLADVLALKTDQFFEACRQEIMGRIRSIFPDEAVELFGSFLLGTSVAVPSPEISEAFRRTGLTHLLVVSGFHLSVLGGVLLGAARSLGLTGLMTLLAISSANIFLTILCGGGPSILRATFMNQITALGTFSGRPRQQLNSFSLAAFLLLLIQPLYLFQPGFQLSFAACGGLVFLAPVLAEILGFLPVWLGPMLAATLAPILLTLPIIACHFSQLAPVSIPANLVILPLAEIVLVGGAAAVGLSFIWQPAGLLAGRIIGAILIGLQEVVLSLARLPGASFYIPRFTGAAVMLYYLLLGQVLFYLMSRKENNRTAGPPKATRRSAPASHFIRSLLRPLPLLAVVILALWQLGPALPAAIGSGRQLTIIFLDVGQGDSCLIETPGGKKILVDGGGRLYVDYAKTVQAKNVQDKMSLERSAVQARLALVPALASLGINRLDLVINTHPDEDHLGGLIEVLKNFRVDRAWETPWAKDNAIYKTWERLLGEKKIPRHFDIRASRQITLEKDIVLKFFNPAASAGPPPAAANPSAGPRAPPDPRHSYNDDSLVFTLTYRNFRLLMAGDASSKVEPQILAAGAGQIKSTVLKVGHHGSRYSSSPEFLAAVRPRIAVISVGAHNRFGHPHQETLDRLRQIGAKIYRTDQNGAVIIKTDGSGLTVENAVASRVWPPR